MGRGLDFKEIWLLDWGYWLDLEGWFFEEGCFLLDWLFLLFSAEGNTHIMLFLLLIIKVGIC